jgi:DNA-directed RNA polymerase
MKHNEEKGRAPNNPYAQAVYRRFVLPLAALIREDLEAKRGAGRKRAHVKLLEGMDADAIAYLAVRQTMALALAGGREGDGRGIIAAVGRSVYHEYLLARFEDVEPELFHTLVNDLGRRLSKSERHRMTVFKMQAQKAGIEFNEWAQGDRDQVGAYLVEQLSGLSMVKLTKFTERNMHGKYPRTMLGVELTPECRELIDKIKGFAAESAPYFLPCVEKPKDWVSVNDGGFHTREMRRLMPWVVKCSPSMRDNFRDGDLKQELAAINALQSVEWKVNNDMLDAIREVAKHFDMEEILSQAEIPKPAKPAWLTDSMKKEDMDGTQLEEFVQWKHSVAEWHTDRKIRGTKLGRFYNAMRIAAKFAPYEKIWFVYFLDFRSRKYVQSTGISPQGSDLQKALLHFATGKALSTPDSIRWFKIAGANRWGYDKVSLEDRAKWVDERDELIRAFAADPISNRGWAEADSPLQFLAWCMEYAAWRDSPATFLSRIAVGMDGSCNGLQNFSAMLRDELGGRATNLVPSPLPNDIYQMVADRTALSLAVQAAVDTSGFCHVWLSHGMNRTLVKRSVMTLPYGSTRYSCAEFIVQDYLKAGKVPEFEKSQYNAAANYLSHPVWDAIGDVVVKAREAMVWLQKGARQIIREGADEVRWVTPTGFPALQMYWEDSVHQIHTKLCGGARLKVHAEVDTPDVNRHKNGIAPNFVHSLDAAHLTLTVNAAKARGIDSLAMIHDDYGTHAADAQALYHVIREEFVGMYERHDMLLEFWERYPTLPAPPAPGQLDIRQVLDSPYFFS